MKEKRNGNLESKERKFTRMGIYSGGWVRPKRWLLSLTLPQALGIVGSLVVDYDPMAGGGVAGLAGSAGDAGQPRLKRSACWG